MLLDNTVFDTSLEQVARDNNLFDESRNYEPFALVLGVSGVISGWEGALSRMKEGEKATALIPSIYGYGNQGQGPIPANSVLVFELDLTENRPYQQP
jgi:FKBP-type peptidyl-prolyl cis-trans isomerase FklB